MSRRLLARHLVTLAPAHRRRTSPRAPLHITRADGLAAYCGVHLADPPHTRRDSPLNATCRFCWSIYRQLPHPDIRAARARAARRHHQADVMTALLGPRLTAWRPTRRVPHLEQLALFENPTVPVMPAASPRTATP